MATAVLRGGDVSCGMEGGVVVRCRGWGRRGGWGGTGPPPAWGHVGGRAPGASRGGMTRCLAGWVGGGE